MVAKKPRVIIIGAGMAGLSAAWQLVRAEVSMFDLKILEASNRIGGRINTSEIGGNRVELGATWIHGMEGSPLYKIAQEIGATETAGPFERQDGFPGEPTIKAEGGLTVPASIVSPIMALYQNLLELIRSHDEKLDPTHTPLSIGAFVAQGFQAFLSQQQSNTSHQLEDLLFDCWPAYKSSWTLRSLQEALLSMYQYMECVDTSANTLHDLDLQTEKEYADYPGEHVTIAKGYMSIINELASSLPDRLIEFGKKVEQIVWNRAQHPPVAIYCGDGSVYEADHVIITTSLGVLKAGIKLEGNPSWANLEGRYVCRSVDSLQAGKLAAKQQELKSVSLFEPPLPAWKVQAISRLGYGLVNKLFLQLNTSALSSSQLQQLNSHIQLVYKNCKELGDPSIPHWMRKTFSISPIYNGSSVLLCWFAGNEALEIESLSDEEIMSGVARTLASFGVVGGQSASRKRGHRKPRDNGFSSGSDSEDSLSRGESLSSSSSDSEENFDEDDGSVCTSEGDFRNMFCGVLRSKWGRDPLFHGSYSFVATGASGDDIEKLAEPLPQLGSDNCACNANDMDNSGAINANDHNYGAINAISHNAFNAKHQAIDEAFNARDSACHFYIHAERGAPNVVKSGGRTTERSRAICESFKDQNVVCRSELGEDEEIGGEAPLQLLFAGEATVRALYSTTHGAHLSGLREANRLLNHYSLSLIAPF